MGQHERILHCLPCLRLLCVYSHGVVLLPGRELHLTGNRIGGNFPSLVSGLSSLRYVQRLPFVFACALAVCAVHVLDCTLCASAAVLACAVAAVLCE